MYVITPSLNSENASPSDIFALLFIATKVSQGHVGSPPRERVRSAAETPSPASAVSLAQPVVAAGQVTDAVPQILILLATTILLATSLRKQGANHVVDKLIQFTRKVTSWIVAHWCRRP